MASHGNTKLRRDRRKKGTAKELERLYLLQLRACFYCRKFRDLAYLTVDHFIPRSLFTGHRATQSSLWWHTKRRNVVLACRTCNRDKAAQHPTQEDIQRYILLFGHQPPTVEDLKKQPNPNPNKGQTT